MVHIVRCAITIFGIASSCTQHLYCTNHKQYNESHSDTTKYGHQNVFGHILTNSHPILMVQGRKLMEICVKVWSNPRLHGKPAVTDINRFFIGPMIVVKTGQLATGPKKTGP